MALEQWTNNAESTLDSSINDVVTSLTVATGDGALFPSLSGDQFFYATLEEGSTIEIVKVTARSSDTFTVERAQQGTSAASFTTAATVELRLTATSLETLADAKMLGTIRAIEGFGSSDYLERATGSALGGNNSTGFEAIVAVIQPDYQNYTAGFIAGASTLVSTEGYGLIVESTQPNPGLAVTGPSREDLGSFDFWRDFQHYRIHIQSVGTDLTDVRATYQGYETQRVTSAGYVTTGLPFRIGRTGFSGANEYGGAVIAFGIKTTGLFTEAELESNIRSLLETGEFDNSVCHHSFTAKDEALGALGSTLTDNGSTGGLDLTRNGTLTVSDFPVQGLVEHIGQDFSTVVNRNSASGALTAGQQNVSASGPTDMDSPEVLVDCSSNAVTITLPSFGLNGGMYRVYDTEGNAGTNNITVARNGNTINGLSEDFVLNKDGQMAIFIYDGTVGTWYARAIPDNTLIESVEDFVADAGTAANRRGYSYGSDPIADTADDFTFCCLFEMRDSRFISGDQLIFGTFDTAGGWGIIRQGSSIGFTFWDNSGTQRRGTSFLPDAINKLVFISVSVTNNGSGNSLTVEQHINGSSRNEYFGGTQGGAYTVGEELCVGVIDEGAITPAANVRVLGCGYRDGTAFSDQVVAAWTKDMQQAGRFIDEPSTGLTKAWRVDGSPGTAWTPFVGTGNLDALNTTALTHTQEAPPRIWY